MLNSLYGTTDLFPEPVAADDPPRSFLDTVSGASTGRRDRVNLDAVDAAARAADERSALFANMVDAAERQTRYVATSSARAAAIEDTWQSLSDRIREATGVTLDNPTNRNTKELASRIARGEFRGFNDPRIDELLRERESVFLEKALALKNAHPDKLGGLDLETPIPQQAARLSARAEADAKEAAAALPFSGQLMAGLLGGIAGSTRDPLFWLSFAAGPSVRGSTAVGRVAWEMATQGALNATFNAAAQPAIQAWRAEAGLENGLMEAVQDIGMSFAVGAAVGGGVRGTIELLPAIRHALTGRATSADFALLEERGFFIPEDMRDALRGGAALDRAETQLPLDLPKNMDADAGRRAVFESAARLEDPQAPLPLIDAPMKSADDSLARRILDEAADADSALAALQTTEGGIDSALASDLPAIQEMGRLAALPDEALALVRSGEVQSDHAALIAATTPDPREQTALAGALRDARPGSAEEARMVMADALAAQSSVESAMRRHGAGTALLPWSPDVASFVPSRPDAPVGVFMFDAARLRTDARRFQYKDNGDAEGVTTALRAVTRWDPAKANQLIVWQDKAGDLFVVDGHQRSGLARRLLASGFEREIAIPGLLFREIDGFGTNDIRAIAAAKNIAERSGSPIDGAKVLRSKPELMDGSMPVTRTEARQSFDLARLADEPFRMVVNEVVPYQQAAIVGRLIPEDGARQLAAMNAIVRFEPRNETETSALVQRVAQSELVKAEGQQGSLFGGMFQADTTAGEEMKIVARAIAELKKDKTLLSRVVANADRIEATGSTIARDAAASVASDAERFAKLISANAYSAGPVRDVLVAIARELKDGQKPLDQTVSELLAAVRRAVETDVFARGEARLPAAEPGADGLDQFLIAGVEPVSQRQILDAEAARPLAGGDAPPPAGGLFDADAQAQPDMFSAPNDMRAAVAARPVFREWERGAPNWTLEEALARAQQNQIIFSDKISRLASEFGLEFKSPGVKRLDRAAEKLADYDHAGQMKDLVRGGVSVLSLEQADQFAAALGRQFPVADKGWQSYPAGYADRKLIVRFDDGQMGEVELWPPGMYEAAHSKDGHGLFKQWRSLPADDPRRDVLMNRMQENYAAVFEPLEASWSKLGSGNASGNSRANASADIMAPPDATLAGSTGFQDPLMNAKAERADTNTAGRPSQSQSFMGDTSKANIGAPGEPVNSPDMRAAVAIERDGATVFVSRDEAVAQARARDDRLAFVAQNCTLI